MPLASTDTPPRFRTRPIKQVYGSKLFFHKLLKDEVCQFDDFLLELERTGGYESDVDQAFAIMEDRAKLLHLPGRKHHELGTLTFAIGGKPHRADLYEVKSGGLRIYYFHQPPTRETVVIMGKKTDQKLNLTQFKNLVKQYLTFLHS